ncbi:MAG: mycofactocin-associated electron transfer flavoprotein alpha subunit [Streptosporangiaceae bacterium]|nr:mycofactocin-associated electron transfer flavoprotein alpha subunit [Streptosporangiaceae bacterium]
MSAGSGPPRIAVIPVRSGVLPSGAQETIAEAGGAALLAGSGTAEAAAALAVDAASVATAEIGEPAFGGWAAALAPLLAPYRAILLPASPDGRDLAPRLAAVMDRPLLAGATEYRDDEVRLARYGGLILDHVTADGPVVVTLQPGVRGTEPRTRDLPAPEPAAVKIPDGHDAAVLAVSPPDPGTMDLAESKRIMAGGAGLRGPGDFRLLARVAAAIGASMGATRVVADQGWVAHERYIGTTGVAVDPDLYIALGISGAIQHVTGLGAPRHVVSVNTDPSCPMMAMADLALVTDAPGLLEALARRLGIEPDAGAGEPEPAGARGQEASHG